MDRGGIKSPWSRRKRKRALTCQHWNRLFSANGKLRDGGRKFLKKVRSGGIEPGIRAEVWPFLLGVYHLNSSEEDRNTIKIKKRKEYEKLRRQCHCVLHCNRGNGLNVINEFVNEDFSDGAEGGESPYSNGISRRACVMPKELKSLGSKAEESESSNWDAVECIDEDTSELTSVDPCMVESESSESESSYEEDPDRTPVSINMEENLTLNQNLSGLLHLSQTFLFQTELPRILPHGSALYVSMLFGQMQNGFYLLVTRLKSLKRKHCSLQYLLG